MPKKKSEEPTKSKSKKSSKKASAGITIDGIAAAPLEPLSLPRQREAGGKKEAAKRELSGDDIALRAYYISQRRRDLNLPGDELGDWIEAERQLRREGLKKPS
jgi:hypothetical protein